MEFEYQQRRPRLYVGRELTGLDASHQQSLQHLWSNPTRLHGSAVKFECDTEFSVQVEVQDEFGNRVTNSNNQVTIAISNNPASGTLSGGGLGLTRSTSNGVAGFGLLTSIKEATAIRWSRPPQA